MMQRAAVSLLAVCLLLNIAVSSARGEECRTGYGELQLTILGAVALSSGEKICGEDLPSKAREAKMRFLMADGDLEIPEGASGVLELDSPTHEILHILRGGKYYGEFIDRRLRETGGNDQRTSLLLEEVTELWKKPLEELKFIYGTEEFVWSKTHVGSVKRKFTPVTLRSDGKLSPRGAVKESVAFRRLATITVNGEMGASSSGASSAASEESKSDELSIAVYYFEPTVSDLKIFRRFPIVVDKQRTVLQFVREGSGVGVTHPAVIRVYRGERQLGEVKVADPGADNFDLALNLN